MLHLRPRRSRSLPYTRRLHLTGFPEIRFSYRVLGSYGRWRKWSDPKDYRKPSERYSA